MTTQQSLQQHRNRRAFSVHSYLYNKVHALNKFFSTANINAVVLGVSGGIDSALVLYLLHEVMLLPNSALKHILPISMPIENAQGVTGQQTAANGARSVIEALGYPFYQVELSTAYHAIINASRPVTNNKPWAEGQMASVLRTPVLYYHAAILQDDGYRSIVVGTTNRDEGSYIGFFGKTSDAAVDIQPLADLHKSEVRALASFLGVPQPIIDAVPKGDVWDNRVDEQMIGANYDMLELHLLSKQYGTNVLATLDDEEKEYYQGCVDHIEQLHNVNAHKYQVGTGAHFVDVMPRCIPGGW